MFTEGQYHLGQIEFWSLCRHCAGYFTFLYTYMILSVQLLSNARLITSPGMFTPHSKWTWAMVDGRIFWFSWIWMFAIFISFPATVSLNVSWMSILRQRSLLYPEREFFFAPSTMVPCFVPNVNSKEPFFFQQPYVRIAHIFLHFVWNIVIKGFLIYLWLAIIINQESSFHR